MMNPQEGESSSSSGTSGSHAVRAAQGQAVIVIDGGNLLAQWSSYVTRQSEEEKEALAKAKSLAKASTKKKGEPKDEAQKQQEAEETQAKHEAAQQAARLQAMMDQNVVPGVLLPALEEKLGVRFVKKHFFDSDPASWVTEMSNFDQKKMDRKHKEMEKSIAFQRHLDHCHVKVHKYPFHYQTVKDGEGNIIRGKVQQGADCAIALELLKTAIRRPPENPEVDTIVLLSGDGDFKEVLEEIVQKRKTPTGKNWRVVVVGWSDKSVAGVLKNLCELCFLEDLSKVKHAADSHRQQYRDFINPPPSGGTGGSSRSRWLPAKTHVKLVAASVPAVDCSFTGEVRDDGSLVLDMTGNGGCEFELERDKSNNEELEGVFSLKTKDGRYLSAQNDTAKPGMWTLSTTKGEREQLVAEGRPDDDTVAVCVFNGGAFRYLTLIKGPEARKAKTDHFRWTFV